MFNINKHIDFRGLGVDLSRPAQSTRGPGSESDAEYAARVESGLRKLTIPQLRHYLLHIASARPDAVQKFIEQNEQEIIYNSRRSTPPPLLQSHNGQKTASS